MPNKPLQKLNEKHRHFAELYLIHFQPQKAAREAGFGKFQGYNLLKNTLIRKYIKRRTGEIMAEIHEEQLKVFRELMNLATSDIRLLYDETGALKPMNQWPESVARCVSSVKAKVMGKGKLQVRSLEVKLWNKNQAIENVARVLGLLTSELKVSLPDNVGAIYFPAPKAAGAPVDAAVIAQDKKVQLKLHSGRKKESDHGHAL